MKRLIVLFLLCLALLPASFVIAQDDLIGPLTYPDGINPLTGLAVDDADMLNRRPLIVRISNYPPLVRERQYGLMRADVVWEYLLSGGVTRFSAVFFSQDPERVGPLRSARLTDFELVRIYRALITYSGMSDGANHIMAGDALMASRVAGGSGPCPTICRFPEDGVSIEHTLFADLALVREMAVERERDVTPEAVYGMAFSETAPAGGTPLEAVRIHYRDMIADWAYDATKQVWVRSTDEVPHIEKESNEQLHTSNVLILEEIHTEQPYVSEGYWGPGDYAFSTNLIGNGRVFLMRDGQYYEGHWERATREDPLTFFDLEGNTLAFKPGNTFITMVPEWIDGYELRFSLADAQIVQPTYNIEYRYGPNDLYVVRGWATPDMEFKALGRNFHTTWLQVQHEDEREVWLPIEALEIGELDPATLPLVRPINEH